MGQLVPRRNSYLTVGLIARNNAASMNQHARILRSLGGHKRVASLFGMPENTVGKWRRRGIPAQHWHRIIALARTKPRGAQRRCEAAE
jgi:hypothetical protein